MGPAQVQNSNVWEQEVEQKVPEPSYQVASQHSDVNTTHADTTKWKSDAEAVRLRPCTGVPSTHARLPSSILFQHLQLLGHQ